MIILQTLTRLLAFVGKELVEVVRRPGAIISLILGPFLIMAIFGMGYQGYRQALQTILVVPPQSGIPANLDEFRKVTPGMEIVEVAASAEDALQRLRDREIDVVIVAPDDTEEQFRAGQQSIIDVHINVVDPVEAAYAGVLAAQMSNAVNQEIIRLAAEEGQGYALRQGQAEAAEIPPEVIAQPTRADVTNEAPIEPGVLPFYGPAVLALILQHLAVTLVALSLVRERTSGIIELFRISPISTTEVIVGKVLAFGVLASMIALATLALLVLGLGVPFLGDPLALAGILALVTLASLALGLLIAVISDGERQAVQLSLLVLLASVFFSGFVLPIEEFTDPVKAIGYSLPVTHGIRLTQDLMLRGWTDATWQIGVLASIAAVLLVVTWVLLRRKMVRV
ncbi:MAG TPA: ABC transporter permease [Vitreimonas sp.]|nr:ABC transporter permease [Vitreimonas sp.]